MKRVVRYHDELPRMIPAEPITLTLTVIDCDVCGNWMALFSEGRLFVCTECGQRHEFTVDGKHLSRYLTEIFPYLPWEYLSEKTKRDVIEWNKRNGLLQAKARFILGDLNKEQYDQEAQKIIEANQQALKELERQNWSILNRIKALLGV